jgi:hypothetical protein
MVTDCFMSGVTKIDENLLPLIDHATERIKDTIGLQKYRSRRAFVDEAVKELLLREGVVLEAQEVPA